MDRKPTGAGGAQGRGRKGDLPESVGEVLARYLKSPAHRERRRLYALAGPALEELLGPQSADIQLLGLRSGVLTIGVGSSALLHELSGFRRAELLVLMRRILGEGRVRDLRFRQLAV